MQSVSFCVWLLSHVMSVPSIHTAAYSYRPFLLSVGWYSIMWVYYHLFIHPTADGHLSSFHYGAVSEPAVGVCHVGRSVPVPRTAPKVRGRFTQLLGTAPAARHCLLPFCRQMQASGEKGHSSPPVNTDSCFHEKSLWKRSATENRRKYCLHYLRDCSSWPQRIWIRANKGTSWSRIQPNNSWTRNRACPGK